MNRTSQPVEQHYAKIHKQKQEWNSHQLSLSKLNIRESLIPILLVHCFTETSLQLSWLTNFETGSECEKFLSLKPIISAKFKLIERNLKWSRSMNIVLVWQFVLTNEIWAKLKLKPAFSSSEYMKQCHETSPERVSRTRCKLVALSDKFCMLTW